jgi:hypothetical protein
MRVVLDHCDCMPARDRRHSFHFASDARIMHKKNGLRAFGNALLDLSLINVERVRSNIHEDRLCAAQDKRI